mgnify:CR=1 FL=1
MDFQKVIALATRRGIFQAAFDAYGGLAGFIDYGPVGVKMRRRIQETWRKHYVIDAGCLELDGALVGPEALFQASGHLGEFDDALVDCNECGSVVRLYKHRQSAHIWQGNLNVRRRLVGIM